MALGATASLTQSPTIALANGATFDVTAQGANFHLVNGQSLIGSGQTTVAGAVTANSGSLILPGGTTSSGTMNIGALTLSTGAAVGYDMGSSQDLINVTSNGGLNLGGGGIDLYQADGKTPFSTPGTYTLMNYSGSLSGAAVSVLNPSASVTYAFAATGESLNLTIQVPNLWTGGASPSFDWSHAANWSTLRALASGNSIAFSGTTGLNSTNDLANLNLTGILFNPSAGAFNLSGNSIQLAGAIVNNSAATQTIGMNIGLVSGSEATFSASAGSVVVNGTISDGGAGLGISTTGSGAVVLAAANTYSGPTTVSAGTLTLAHPLAVQYSTVNVGGGGTLGFAGGIISPILGGLAGNGNIALTTAAAGAVTLNVGSNGQSTTYNGSLNGFGSLVKQGAGTLTLTNTNGYSGATLISGGVLQLAPPFPTNVFGASGASIGIHFVGNGSAITGSDGPPGAVMSNWNNFSGTSNSNQALIDYSGAATTATVTYSANGTFSSGSSDQLLNGYIYTFNSPGVTATVNGIPYPRYSIYVFSVDQNAGSPTYEEEISVGGANYYYQPLYSGPTAYTQITNTSTGSFPLGDYVLQNDLAGSSQTVTVLGVGGGGVAGFAGIEIVSDVGAGGTILPATTPVTISNGATFDMTNVVQTIFSLSSTDGMGSQVLLGSGALTIAGTASTTFDGVISGAGGSLTMGGGGLTLTGVNTFSGSTTVAAGMLQLGTGQSGQDGSIANTSVVTDNGSLVYNLYGNQAVSYAIGGIGSLTKLGQGMLTLNGSNTYSGGTTVSNGTLQMGSANALGGGGLTVNGGVVDLNGSAITIGSYLNGNGGTITDNSGAGQTVLTVNQLGNSIFRGAIHDGPMTSVGLALTGVGRFTLAGANTYSGPTTVYGCTLNAAANNAFSPNSAVTVDYGGTLDATGFTQTVAALTVGSLGTLNLSLGNILTSTSAAYFVTGSTLNLSGAVTTLPEVLMTYNGYFGNFSAYTLNGSTLPGTDLYYATGGLELVAAPAGPATWAAAVSGNWSAGSNWSSGIAPNGAGQGAVLNATTRSDVTVTLDAPQTVGTLEFGNPGGNPATGYILSGANSLTLDNSGNAAVVSATEGTHEILAAIELNGSVSVSLSGNSLLAIGGDISENVAGTTLTLGGDGSGELILSGSNSYTGGTIVASGTLAVTAATALPEGSSLTIGAGGTFIFDPTASAAPLSVDSAAGIVQAVPEPGALALLAVVGVLAVAALVRSRRAWGNCKCD